MTCDIGNEGPGLGEAQTYSIINYEK